MATFIVRALGLAPTETDYFTDDDNSSHQASINALAASGITLGCSDGPGLYCPKDEIQRDQMAAFLYRGRMYLP